MRFLLSPQIHVSETAKAFLEELPMTLLRAGYKANVENALMFERDIISFINLLPTAIHHPILPQFAHHCYNILKSTFCIDSHKYPRFQCKYMNVICMGIRGNTWKSM